MWISLMMLDCYLTQSPETGEDKGEGFPMSYLRNSTRSYFTKVETLNRCTVHLYELKSIVII